MKRKRILCEVRQTAKYLALSFPTRLARLRNPDASPGRVSEECTAPLTVESSGRGVDIHERVLVLCDPCRRPHRPRPRRLLVLVLDENRYEKLVLKRGLGVEELSGVCCQVLLSYARVRHLVRQLGRLRS